MLHFEKYTLKRDGFCHRYHRHHVSEDVRNELLFHVWSFSVLYRQDIFQACRGWTIARYQHVVQHDFSIRLLETSVTVGLDDDAPYILATTGRVAERLICR